jgi:L-2,4-diaminobutyrate decarboxylase
MMTKLPVKDLFLGHSPEAWSSYQQAISAAQTVLYEHYASLNQPFSGTGVDDLVSLLKDMPVCPEEGRDLGEVLEDVGVRILRHSVRVHDPACSAHLHCPPLTPALAAELLISATNQSMDSWDQSPAATILEEKMVSWLCSVFYGNLQGDGVFTSGGTQSNLMGLLLARDHFLKQKLNINGMHQGLPPEAGKMKVLCSDIAHFTIKQSAALLGLGENAVVPVKTDTKYQMSLTDLDEKISQLKKDGYHLFAIVATAGTTDFGSIDPLQGIADRAEAENAWFHVDAAYGGALALSEKHRHRLDGIGRADSLSVDFHKLFYQPISCGAFLLKDGSRFQLIKRHADYLNSEEDERMGIPHLVHKSVQTTRRFDALKLFVSLQAVGKKRFAGMIDHTIGVTKKAADWIRRAGHLQLVNDPPQMNALVFRYVPRDQTVDIHQLNRDIRQRLLQRGKAVMALTKVDGLTSLKLTIINPRITLSVLTEILEEVRKTGLELEEERREKDSYGG